VRTDEDKVEKRRKERKITISKEKDRVPNKLQLHSRNIIKIAKLYQAYTSWHIRVAQSVLIATANNGLVCVDNTLRESSSTTREKDTRLGVRAAKKRLNKQNIHKRISRNENEKLNKNE
jgi:hypothetical protein